MFAKARRHSRVWTTNRTASTTAFLCVIKVIVIFMLSPSVRHNILLRAVRITQSGLHALWSRCVRSSYANTCRSRSSNLDNAYEITTVERNYVSTTFTLFLKWGQGSNQSQSFWMKSFKNHFEFAIYDIYKGPSIFINLAFLTINQIAQSDRVTININLTKVVMYLQRRNLDWKFVDSLPFSINTNMASRLCVFLFYLFVV